MTLLQLIRLADGAGLIGSYRHDRTNYLARARRAYKRNLAEPSDCKGDTLLLMGLAIAFADLGYGQGWIPRVQMLGCKIADLGKPMVN